LKKPKNAAISPPPRNISAYCWKTSTACNALKVSVGIGGDTYDFPETTLQAVPYAKVAERSLLGDADSNPTNEIQTLSLSGNQLSLSPGGGSVNIPAAGNYWTENANGSIVRENGFVGVGTANPQTSLHVKNLTGEFPLILEGAQNQSGILFTGTGGIGQGWIIKSPNNLDIGTQTAADGDVNLWPGNGLALTAKTNGNIGIGTSNPASLLHLGGDNGSTALQMTNNLTGNTINDGTLFYNEGNNFNIINREIGQLILRSQNGPSFLNIGNNRNMGINTMAPIATLHLNQDCCFETSLQLTGNDAGETINDGARIAMSTIGTTNALRLSNLENGPIQFAIGTGSKVEITASALSPVDDDLIDTRLNHDELYTRFDVIGEDLLYFMKNGMFPKSARRDPYDWDVFEKFKE